jgi:XapX domain-containing protein
MIRITGCLAIGLLIDARCRWFDVPVPSPPKLVGALLVVAMTIGYMLLGWELGPEWKQGRTTRRGDTQVAGRLWNGNVMKKIVTGLMLSLLIGAGCR